MASSRHNIRGKAEVDPEEQLKRKFRAKCRFRGIVRLALANAYWLSEEVEQYEGLDNVKKRIAHAMRGRKKRLLTLPDKAILNKPAEYRTDQEKMYLYRIIGGLKCFKRYPKHVKRKLAAATYFKYYKPGHVIVREDQEARAMYFIVEGNLKVTRNVLDELLNISIPTEIRTMKPGDLFGDVSLLHNIPRTATCTTMNHCELLILKKEDFKHILQSTIQASWDKVLHAMSYFTYFDGLDEVARRDGCIMAKMKSYAKNDIILGDGVGINNYVYFVLSGSCQMIESLQISSVKVTGRTIYKLFDPHVTEAESDQDIDDKYFSVKQSKASIITKRSSYVYSKISTASNFNDVKGDKSKSNMNESGHHCKIVEMLNDEHMDEHTEEIKETPEAKILSGPVQYQIESKPEETIKLPKVSISNTDELYHSAEHFRESVRFSTTKNMPGLVSNLQTYFMQVCHFNPGSTFGFGENMRDRRIVALTQVHCMLLPKIWLLERNIANIWSRIQHFLEKKIPTKRQLFDAFVLERRWTEYREETVSEVVARSNVVNWTSVHDVPYCIRLEEMTDL